MGEFLWFSKQGNSYNWGGPLNPRVELTWMRKSEKIVKTSVLDHAWGVKIIKISSVLDNALSVKIVQISLLNLALGAKIEKIVVGVLQP